nr:hypothetical protein Iba_chr03cCG1410 [Ipomoea batatas]
MEDFPIVKSPTGCGQGIAKASARALTSALLPRSKIAIHAKLNTAIGVIPPPNTQLQFGAQYRRAYNISHWPHPVGDFVVGEFSNQDSMSSHKMGLLSTGDFLDIQEPQLRRSTRIRFPTHCGTHPRQRYI